MERVCDRQDGWRIPPRVFFNLRVSTPIQLPWHRDFSRSGHAEQIVDDWSAAPDASSPHVHGSAVSSRVVTRTSPDVCGEGHPASRNIVRPHRRGRRER